uniref:Uncharacterized protein n=1 Tax=Oryza brachyantha TaxID=4533 RepID=J3MHX5_ORYBR
MKPPVAGCRPQIFSTAGHLHVPLDVGYCCTAAEHIHAIALNSKENPLLLYFSPVEFDGKCTMLTSTPYDYMLMGNTYTEKIVAFVGDYVGR